MKTVIVCALVLMLANIGCRHDGSSPVISPAFSNGVSPQVPDPVLVPFSNIPFPFPDDVYRIAGSDLASGPVAVLERVLDAGFALKRAWHPQLYICMAPFLDELIVELEQPDDAIFDLGFTRDFSGTAGSCATHWNEYNFGADNPGSGPVRRSRRSPGRR